jgi:hypothetical protein
MTNQPPSPPSPPPADDRYLGWLNAVKGLSISNVLVIAALAIVAVPVYVIYRALDDEKLLDRFMSTYEEEANQQSGCTLRHVQERGGPDIWGISSGFAFAGAERWFISVALSHDPSNDEVVSYCESLKLIADRMMERGRTNEIPPPDIDAK